MQQAFAEHRIDNWIHLANDPALGEVATFQKLLESIPREDGVTFYGHAKGVSYDDPLIVRDWTSMLYEICLDDADFVESHLREKELAGPFPVDNRWPGGNRYGWYFSGSFFWFRNSAAFGKPDWNNTRQDRWGVELWPGHHWNPEEFGTLFGQTCGHLYEQDELTRMKQWYLEWAQRKKVNV